VVIPFFILAYALMWTCFLSVVFLGISGTSPLGAGLLLLGTFAPAIAALALTAAAEGPLGVRCLLRRVLNPPAAGRWYFFAVTFMAIVKVIAALAHRTALGIWPRFGTEPLLLLPVAVAVSTPFQIGEELGWRGYALPRLESRLGMRAASLLLGAIWAFWHLPQFYIKEADTYGQSFPLFVLQVIAMSVAIAWLYTRVNGTLLPLMVMHAAVNNTKDIVPSATPGATDSFTFHASPVAWITVVVLWIAAVFFLADMPSRSQEAIGVRVAKGKRKLGSEKSFSG
jgi:membrane protease YdiL (CAAX protease family)